MKYEYSVIKFNARVTMKKVPGLTVLPEYFVQNQVNNNHKLDLL